MVTAACVPSDLYSYIYHFLVSNELNKTAKYLKKETRLEFATPAGPTLVEVFNRFLSRHNQDNGEENSEVTAAEKKKPSVEENNNEKQKEKKSNKKSKKRKLEESDDKDVLQKKFKKEEVNNNDGEEEKSTNVGDEGDNRC